MGVTEKADPNPPRKVGLSCAECRRSKLKCDRVFPCQSCVRRGCASICPDGILPATKGNKVLMAHAQELSKQVKQLTMRVRELEELLEMRAPHLLKMKVERPDSPMGSVGSETGSEVEFTEDVPPAANANLSPPAPSHSAAPMPTSPPASQRHERHEQHERHERHAEEGENIQGISEALGSLAIGQDGQMRYRGVTAGAEYLEDLLPSTYDESKYRLRDLGFPREIMELAMAFPFGLKDSSHKKELFRPFIPPQEFALRLFDTYYEYCAWMYNPIARSLFIRTFMEPIYGSTGIPSTNIIHSHKLSVFFIIIANGALYAEESGEQAHWLSARYHQLARAALSLDSMLTDASVATCEALFMMIRYLFNSDRSANEERWLITGLAARVAQMIGLQRDSGGWTLPHEEVQRRRGIFWAIWTWDTYTAIVNGRPGCLTIDHTDCQLPDDLYAIRNARGELEAGYQNWRTLYCIKCLTVSADHVFATKTPPYSHLLELDRKLRELIPPEHLWTPANPKNPNGWPNDSKLACEQATARFLKESNLLYIHRSYFAQALRSNPTDPFKHDFAPSVYAVITSARTICQHIHGLYAKHRRIVRHGWYFWTAVYSSCIVLSAVVVECPAFTLAHECYIDLKEALTLYEEGSRPCRSEASLRHMQRLVERAEQSLEAYHCGQGIDRQPTDPSEPDALDVLGGRKSLIVPKSNNNSPSNNSDASLQRPTQPSPVAAPAPMPSQAGAVEMLNQYYQSENENKHEIYNYFSPQLEAQYPTEEMSSSSPEQQHLTQPQYSMHSNAFTPYPTDSGPLSPTSPSSLSQAGVVAMDTYSVPSEVGYSPQFEVSSAYSSHTLNNGMSGDMGSSHSWQQQQQQSSSSSASNIGQYQPQSPTFADGNAVDLGYNMSSPISGNGPFQHAQSPQMFAHRMAAAGMSQGDIWSNFAQDFRP